MAAQSQRTPHNRPSARHGGDERLPNHGQAHDSRRDAPHHGDGGIPYGHEVVYFLRVAGSWSLPNLTQLPVHASGHSTLPSTTSSAHLPAKIKVAAQQAPGVTPADMVRGNAEFQRQVRQWICVRR
jgi:hypothetical protein